jgi:ribosomal protein S18 acetylase RimI-like enzyme
MPAKERPSHSRSTANEAAAGVTIAVLDHHDGAVAEQVQQLVALASAQEASLLGLAPAEHSAAAVQSSPNLHLGARSADGALLGLLCIGADDEPNQLAIHTLVVSPVAQRQGIATALLQDALARGPGLAFAVITAAANTPAVALYTRSGFAVYRHGFMGDGGVPVLKLRRAVPAAAG